MALVIAHAELVSDQTSDPRTAPQWRREAVRLGAFQQQRLEASALICGSFVTGPLAR